MLAFFGDDDYCAYLAELERETETQAEWTEPCRSGVPQWVPAPSYRPLLPDELIP